MSESQDESSSIKEIRELQKVLQLLAPYYENEMETAENNRQKFYFQKALRKVWHYREALKRMLFEYGIDEQEMLAPNPDWQVVLAEKRIRYMLYLIALDKEADSGLKTGKQAKLFGEWMLS